MFRRSAAAGLLGGGQVLLAAWGWAALAATALPDGQPLRIAVVFGFLLLGPGLAIARLLPVGPGTERWVLAAALSMALSALVSVAFVPFGVQSPVGPIVVLASIVTIASLVPWALDRSRERASHAVAEAY